MRLNQSLGLRNEKNLTENYIEHSTFKYTLRCSNCSWNSSFYEETGSIGLDRNKMICPICKNREIGWLKSLVQNPVSIIMRF